MSIVESDVRSDTIMRLYEAGKAAYSDLLDSAGVTDVLGSRGNFNYHLNYLLDNSLVAKNDLLKWDSQYQPILAIEIGCT